MNNVKCSLKLMKLVILKQEKTEVNQGMRIVRKCGKEVRNQTIEF